MENQTTMTLTKMSSGMTSQFSGRNSTTSYSSSISAVSGYSISSAETSDGLTHNIVTLTGQKNVADPATVILEVEYDQKGTYPEVDLEARFTAIPAKTSLQVSSTAPNFSISKQELTKTSGLVSSIDTDVAPFKATFALSLWITDPDALTQSSSVSIDMVSVDSGSGGPVKKTVLAKIELKLS